MNRILTLALVLSAATAHAALPPPTPAQQEAAAAKKAAADAQAAKDKALLAASMDAITARWRARAGAQGLKTHAPVAIAAAAPAATGAPAAAAATGAPAQAAAPAGQPEGKLTPAGAAAPIKSEKLGTAPPSADVKAGPTKAEPSGTPPTVQKGTPKVNNK
jgi:colicin import membrane protein